MSIIGPRRFLLRKIVVVIVIVIPIYFCCYLYSFTPAQLESNNPDIPDIHPKPYRQSIPDSDGEPSLNDISNPFNTNCKSPYIKDNVDYNHKDKHIKFWNQITDKSIELFHGGWKEFVLKEESKQRPMWNEDQGIVFVAGNDDTMKRTVGTIRLLRYIFKCSLNIEIWHLENEADAVMMFKTELDELGDITLRDFSDNYLVKSISRSRNVNKQFQVKAAAIINSRFQHVLYLDSDNIPTKDPTFLFESDEYKQYGAIFWPDFWKTDPQNKIFRILEVHCEDEWEQESGQIIVDKKRHWMPLQLAWYMQFYHEVYFKFLNGDKDTFQYAWRALQAPFYRIKTFLGMGGLFIDGNFCGHSMLQYVDTENGRLSPPLFVHANLMKQMSKNVFIDRNGTEERPWHHIKRYTNNQATPMIHPVFNMVFDSKSNQSVGCMDFTRHLDEDKYISVDSFDVVLPMFQNTYMTSGGIGGNKHIAPPK